MEPHLWAAHTGISAALIGPTVRPWDISPAVAELQELLIAHGFSKLRVDGNFGYLTEAAVKTLQRQHGLRIDGCVGPRTWTVLKTAIQPGSRLLRRGHTGADVAELQGLLRVNGYAIDRSGIFCPQTQVYTIDFQQQHKLRTDGVVDAFTWALLRGRPLAEPCRKQRRWFWDNRKWW
ncbi:peptidoglycan-binding domain-containing protein [Stenomitos frigidus]|uniref:peptidoglycan-binding domain-containing protein n=1 Tax=Stenomitos frigidus TaxID=1886765 RepID=UPI001FE704EA|nr:peptidoglycan-binding protein [Stenomitos frigidus]